MNAFDNRLLFLRWARANFPSAYEEAVANALQDQPGLSGFFDTVTSLFDKVANAIPNIAQAYTTAKAQIDWLKLNADRAKKGLPPLDPSTGQPVQATGVPAPPANSQAAKVEQTIVQSDGVPTWVWVAGAGVLFLIASRL